MGTRRRKEQRSGTRWRSPSGSESSSCVSRQANPPAPDTIPAARPGCLPGRAQTVATRSASIEVRDLTKRYGKTVAVDHLSFEVHTGRVTGFLGPNGAGKSTTLRLILGLDNPASGSALVNGRPFAYHHQPLLEVGALLDPKAFHPGAPSTTSAAWRWPTGSTGAAPRRSSIWSASPASPPSGRAGSRSGWDNAWDRLRAAGRPGHLDPRRARQRARPRRHLVDPEPPALPTAGGSPTTWGLPLVAARTTGWRCSGMAQATAAAIATRTVRDGRPPGMEDRTTKFSDDTRQGPGTVPRPPTPVNSLVNAHDRLLARHGIRASRSIPRCGRAELW